MTYPLLLSIYWIDDHTCYYDSSILYHLSLLSSLFLRIYLPPNHVIHTKAYITMHQQIHHFCVSIGNATTIGLVVVSRDKIHVAASTANNKAF